MRLIVPILLTLTLGCEHNEHDKDGDGVLASADCDDSDASKPLDDADCDGTLTADDCDDRDDSVGAVFEDGDCDPETDTRVHCPGNVVVTDNDGLAAFEGCEVIDGSLVIGTKDLKVSSSVTNVDALSSLTSVEGGLFIRRNDALTDIDGLSNLTSVGENIGIRRNDALTDIDGLSSLWGGPSSLYTTIS